jgi:hypothetical protein
MSETRRTSRAEFAAVSFRTEARLTRDALAAAAGITVESLDRLVSAGLVEPPSPETGEFTAAGAARLRRMLRLHHDLDLDLEAAAIVVDLLERLERLEDEIARLRSGS